ncbi:MAG: CHASE2 domain-containing sensor protein, partial [Cognaticolwellia sp.]
MSRPWWRKARLDEECEEPASHLIRSMAYETLVVGFTAIAVGVLAFLVSRGQLEDLYLKARGSAPVSNQVAVLSIGPEALYLWNAEQPQPEITPRAMLAELVRFADHSGASVIVLDVMMEEPQAGDDALVKAAAKARAPVVAATRFVPTAPTSKRDFQPGLSPSLQDVIQPGFANLQVEQPWLFADGQLVRHAPLVRQVSTARIDAGAWPWNLVGAEQADHALVPSMTLLAAMLHVGSDAEALQSACDVVPGEALRCSKGTGALGLPEIPLPLEQGMVINFRGPEGHDGITSVRAASVLRAVGPAALAHEMGMEMSAQAPELEAALKDKVVLIGRVDRIGQDDADQFVTPYSFPTLLQADMAGVQVQAQVIDTLISGRHIRQPRGWS